MYSLFELPARALGSRTLRPQQSLVPLKWLPSFGSTPALEQKLHDFFTVGVQPKSIDGGGDPERKDFLLLGVLKEALISCTLRFRSMREKLLDDGVKVMACF